MIRAVVIDDEPKNTRILINMIQEFCPEIIIQGKASDSQEGVEVILREKPDLVFLDIEMPYGNAFEMLDQLQPIDFDIIFVTAFENYSLKAFRYEAIDYLLKPIEIEELLAAVNRVKKRRQAKSQGQYINQLEQLLNNLNRYQSGTVEKIALPSQDGLIFIALSTIIRCEAKGSYTHFFRQEEEKIIAGHNIKEYEELLPEKNFFRIHNSHIINLNFVIKYHRGRGGYIEMADGALLEVATRRKDEFLTRFGFKQ